MNEHNIHKQFRDVASISLLFAAFEKSFPLFHNESEGMVVGGGGKISGEKIFLTLKEFSTGFPHTVVDKEGQ